MAKDKGFRSGLDRARRILGPGILASGLVFLAAAVLYFLEKLGIRLEKASGRSAGGSGGVHDVMPFRGDPVAGRGPSEESLRHGHEPVQIKASLLIGFAASLLAGIAVVLVTLWILLEAFSDRKIAIAPRPASLPQPADAPLHGEFRSRAPGLFRDPAAYLRDFRAREEAAKPDYAWVDRERGVVSIPVERAMALIAERGLPEWDISDTAAGGRPILRGPQGSPGSGVESRMTP